MYYWRHRRILSGSTNTYPSTRDRELKLGKNLLEVMMQLRMQEMVAYSLSIPPFCCNALMYSCCFTLHRLLELCFVTLIEGIKSELVVLELAAGIRRPRFLHFSASCESGELCLIYSRQTEPQFFSPSFPSFLLYRSSFKGEFPTPVVTATLLQPDS